jgi:pimeloyl-ACP methyl ester carboxylesterase
VLAQEEYRLTRMMPAAGFDRADVEQALALLRARAEAGATGDPEAVYAAEARWHTAPWYPMLAGTTPAEIAFALRNLAYDPAAALAALRRPLLAIFGADDLFVPLDAGTGPPQVVDGRYHPGVRAPGFDELVVTWLRSQLPAEARLRNGW